jgi:hypothetical protein
MGSNYTGLTVTWIDESSGYTSTDNITADVLSIPIFTDTGSGEVNEAEIVLSAKGGKYITSGNKIDKYDRITIAITDLGSNSYNRSFEVVKIIPTQTKGEGSILTLQCVGIEYHTQVIHYARRDWFQQAYDVSTHIVDAYNSNRGSRQPLLQNQDTVWNNSVGNALPKFTNNHYEFGSAEDSCYNRLLDLTTLLGGAVTNGGVGDFFELGFDTPSPTALDFALFRSGSRTWDGNDPSNDASGVVIENTANINVSEQEGGIANPTGTKSAAWGSPTHGSLPVGTSKYRAHELEFAYRPSWLTGITYKVGAKVVDTLTQKHYECAVEHTASALMATDISGGKWTLIDFSSEFGDNIQYSEWTDGKAALWANAGSDPDAVTSVSAWASSTSYVPGDLVTNSGNTYVATLRHTSSGSLATDITNGKMERVDNALKGNGAAFFDINTTVRDDGIFFRTWVNAVIGDTNYDTVSDATHPTEYLHGNTKPPIGYRVLQVGNTQLAGASGTEKDLKGKLYKDAVVEFKASSQASPDTGVYEVVYEQPTVGRTQVFDIKDRKIWEWNTGTSQWEDKTTDGSYRNDDNAHQWKSIYNIQGSDPRPTKQSTTPFNEDANDFSTNIRSAVEVCYEFDGSSIVQDFIGSTADTKKGAWLNFGFPFPISTYNSIGEGLGDIYGGGTNEKSDFITQPSLLDAQNMTWTSDGKIGFNHTTSEELGPISSLAFNMRIAIENTLGQQLGGTVNVRCWIYDTHDNIKFQDFEIRFTDFIGSGKGFQSVNLPMGGFNNYRGREPKNAFLRSGSKFGITLPIQELDIQDVFREHEIKYIGFQIQDYYDEQGRYDPNMNIMDMTNTGSFGAAGGTIRMAIDAFHFKKVLLAITGQPSVQNIEPQFLQRPNIISYLQLKNEVNSQLEIEQFRHKEYNFQTSGNTMFDIRFGDTFFLKNDEIVDDADYTESTLGTGDGTANHVRLVAKRIEYHLTKPRSGPGGITRSIKGVKRFVS